MLLKFRLAVDSSIVGGGCPATSKLATMVPSKGVAMDCKPSPIQYVTPVIGGSVLSVTETVWLGPSPGET